MRTRLSTLESPAPVNQPGTSDRSADAIPLDARLTHRVRGEYTEMPGMRLTVPQAARLFGLTIQVAEAVLGELRRTSFLGRSGDGKYALATGPLADDGGPPHRTKHMNTPLDNAASLTGSLKDASPDRLACLLRHWTWADEARAAFERELAGGWEYDEDLTANHPFGSYYHWCALLAGFAEAAVERDLLHPAQLEAIRVDLDASLPGLLTCREILVTIPSSMEEQPRVVDLLRDADTRARLGRLHQAFGDAIRQEHVLRQIDALDP